MFVKFISPKKILCSNENCLVEIGQFHNLKFNFLSIFVYEKLENGCHAQPYHAWCMHILFDQFPSLFFLDLCTSTKEYWPFSKSLSVPFCGNFLLIFLLITCGIVVLRFSPHREESYLRLHILSVWYWIWLHQEQCYRSDPIPLISIF